MRISDWSSDVCSSDLRNIGASLGISVVSFLLARNIQISHADLAGHITAFNLPNDPNTALRFGQSGDSAMEMLDGAINRQAAMIGYLNEFHFMKLVQLPKIPVDIGGNSGRDRAGK